MRVDTATFPRFQICHRNKIAYLGVLLFGASILWTTNSWAQQAANIYIGGSAGISRSPGVSMVGDSNDRSSICDEFINPLYAALSQCTVPNRGEGDSWTVPFDGTGGAFGSMFAGYRFSPLLRAELEYILRVSNYGERSPVTTAQGVNADKLSDELFLAEEWLGTVSMFGLFANVHFDLHMIKSPILPYLGIGVGVGNTKVDYGSVWSRSPDPRDIRTGRDQPNADEIVGNLAGVASSGHATMQETQLTLQIIAGGEYFVGEKIAFDLRARFMVSQEFEGRIVWDPLRSHVPNLRRDGSEPVDGLMTTDDFSALVLSFGMKYYF